MINCSNKREYRLCLVADVNNDVKASNMSSYLLECYEKAIRLWHNPRRGPREYFWLAIYLLYLLLVSVLTFTYLGPWLVGRTDLGPRLEFASGFGLTITYLIIWFVFVRGRPHEETWEDRLRGTLAPVALLVTVGFLLDTRVTRVLTMLHHFLLVFLFGLLFTILDWRRYKRGGQKPEEPINLKATLAAADIPLLVGLVLVMAVARFQLLESTKRELFLGGALALKLGYYYGSFCLINAFLPPEKAQGQQG